MNWRAVAGWMEITIFLFSSIHSSNWWTSISIVQFIFEMKKIKFNKFDRWIGNDKTNKRKIFDTPEWFSTL